MCMNRMFKVSLRVGRSALDSFYCSYPFSRMQLCADGVKFSQWRFRSFELKWECITQVNLCHGMLCRYISFEHRSSSVPPIVHVYCFHVKNVLNLVLDNLREMRRRFSFKEDNSLGRPFISGRPIEIGSVGS